MNQCFLIDNILDTIVDKLSVRQRFLIQSVSHKWRQSAKSSLSCQKRLLIVNQFKQFPAHYKSLCPHHKLYKTDLVGHKMSHMAFWKRVLKAMTRLEVIYVSCPSGNHWNETSTPVTLMRLIMEKYHTTLKCLYTEYKSWQSRNTKKNSFPFVSSLPHLRHLTAQAIEGSDMNALLSIAPNLEHISFFTIGWVDSKLDTRLFPKGLKSVLGPFYGLEGICLSPVSQTLECISELRLKADTSVRICNFPNLQRLGVAFTFNEDPQKCVEVLANLLSNCPNLTRFAITGISDTSFDAPTIKSWLTVLSYCSNVTEFYLSYDIQADKKSSDMFVQQMVKTMTGCKKLTLSGPIYSDEFIHLSNLNHLESLKLRVNMTSHDFDSELFLYFLQTSLGKKLRNLDIHGSIRVPASFPDRVKNLCDTLNLKSYVGKEEAKEGEACDPDYVTVTWISVNDIVRSEARDR